MLPIVAVLAAVAVQISAAPSEALRSGVAIPDHELATMRGGVLLPNGLTIAIGIDIQTRIDGVLALHTVYTSETPANGVRVFTDGTDSPRIAPGSATVVTGGGTTTNIDVSRSPTGTTVVAGTNGQPTTVNIVSGPTSTWLSGAGQTSVPVVANGPAVSASSGLISLTENDRGARVTLSTPMLEVQHLVGQATGAVISNTGNDRSIDTISSINVNLVGVPAALLGNALMVNRIAVEAAGRR